MRRWNIKASTQVAEMFEQVAKECAVRAEADDPNGPPALRVESEHVAGTFNILERNRLLALLKEPVPEDDNICRILSNARCLSEGVDVPALDVVLFLNPRKSVVDVVQIKPLVCPRFEPNCSLPSTGVCWLRAG